MAEPEDQTSWNPPPQWLTPPCRKCLRERRLSKQLTLNEIPRNKAWEKRRRRREMRTNQEAGDVDLTDEDLDELKGCIDLGFGFNQEQGQQLCATIPALDLYFAVNRAFVPSPMPSPTAVTPNSGLSSRSSSVGSNLSEADSWKICNPGDDPQQVKTKLRHWAQAVACSVRQST